jgi:chemotaxis family two-component system sensor kinase Cph1
MDKKFQYFHIKDNGIGIKKEARVQIFKLFQRLHSQEKYEGTGVGLALCKKIIEGHGGRIWLEPIKNNNGSHFVFKIPRP